jgi:hypothetical protein
MSRDREYAARLFLHWLNERYRRSYAPSSFEGELWQATDEEAPERGKQIAIVSDRLFEATETWDSRCRELGERLDESRPGSYLLWIPPGGKLPPEEPEESEWVRRVVLGASRLASGRVAEARLPSKMMLAKTGDEGGYASVVGGLSRYWTTITDKVNGTFYVDSKNLHRLTRSEEEREELFEQIGLLSQGLGTGQAAEFEHEDAWSVQRLPRGAAAASMTDGWAITGCPDGFDPFDGGLIRRMLRQRLARATQLMSGWRDIRALVLIGAYDYMENENAGPAMRGFDPALATAFDVVALVSDAEVKPIVLSRNLAASAGGASP